MAGVSKITSVTAKAVKATTKGTKKAPQSAPKVQPKVEMPKNYRDDLDVPTRSSFGTFFSTGKVGGGFSSRTR